MADEGPVFTCAICERDARRWFFPDRKNRAMPPICEYCESQYGDRAPAHGAFMDRRAAVRLSALANALSGAAHYKQWEGRYAKA